MDEKQLKSIEETEVLNAMGAMWIEDIIRNGNRLSKTQRRKVGFLPRFRKLGDTNTNKKGE